MQDRASGHTKLNVRFNRFVDEVYVSLVSDTGMTETMSRVVSWIPYKHSSRCSRMAWSTVSKAADKSSIANATISPKSTADSRSERTCAMAVPVERAF